MDTLTGTTPDTNAKPSVKTGTFWERVAKLGVHGIATLGLLAAATYFVYRGIAVPQWYYGLVVGVTGWLVVSDYRKGKAK